MSSLAAAILSKSFSSDMLVSCLVCRSTASLSSDWFTPNGGLSFFWSLAELPQWLGSLSCVFWPMAWFFRPHLPPPIWYPVVSMMLFAFGRVLVGPLFVQPNLWLMLGSSLNSALQSAGKLGLSSTLCHSVCLWNYLTHICIAWKLIYPTILWLCLSRGC